MTFAKPETRNTACCLVVIACAFFLATPACLAAEISGQVFIATKTGDSKKLALVNVSAYPEKSVYENIQKIQKNEGTVSGRLPPLLATRQTVLSELLAAKSSLAFGEMLYGPAKQSILRDESEKAAAQKELATYQKRFTDAMSAGADIAAKIDTLSSVSPYLQGLPKPLDVAKSDADGKFLLKVPSGKYILIAKASRLAGDSAESYQWLVLVNTGQTRQPVMLSNDNLFQFGNSACSECVQIE